MTPADQIQIANQAFMIKMLYGLLALAVLGAATVAVVIVVGRSTLSAINDGVARWSRLYTQNQDLAAKIEVLVHVAKAEGSISDAQKERSRANLEKTERVLEEIRTKIPRVVHEAVHTVAQSIPPTPSDQAIPVVVRRPEPAG